jgi:cation diffusion facilitator family transporter
MVDTAKENLYLQRWIAAISLILLGVKFFAFYMTKSVSVLTDALESIVNVTAGFIGLYSLYIAAKPRDKDHPYGHGKAEFISAAIEGTLIIIAGLAIIYKAVENIFYPVALQKLDKGMILVALTAVVNIGAGLVCIKKGNKNNSPALLASGKHLMTDSYSTLGIIVGLLLIYFSGLEWIDSFVALLISIIIIVTGYKIIRQSIAGIMDEADEKLLEKLIALLYKNKSENWVDLHNLRVIKYGSVLHLDAHLTVPWFLNVHEAHKEIDALAALVKNEFGDSLELFVHSDGCLPFSCRICNKKDCAERQHDFEKEVSWNLENILKNEKFQLP